MFDIKKTLDLIKGAIFDPETTWDRYLPEAGDWKRTVVLLTGPLIVLSAVLSYILSFVFPSRLPFLPDVTFTAMLMSIVIGALAAAGVAFVVAFLAGMFKGTNSFPHALAATSLAFVPGYVGQAFMHLPWIGGLLSFGLGIYGLVLLWRILPKYMQVPLSSRVGHYILSLVGSVVVFIVLGSVLGVGTFGSVTGQRDLSDLGAYSNTSSSEPRGSSPGMFGGIERQGKIIEAAENDTYDPPRDGRLSRSQVETYLRVLTRTREYRESQAQALEELGKKAEANESGSWSDAMSGMAGVLNITTAEMEVVKTGGGNWAEHQWVGEQLRVARIQKDLDAASKHNYELYLEFEGQLRELGQY